MFICASKTRAKIQKEDMRYKNTVTIHDSSEEQCQDVADLEGIYLQRTEVSGFPVFKEWKYFMLWMDKRGTYVFSSVGKKKGN